MDLRLNELMHTRVNPVLACNNQYLTGFYTLSYDIRVYMIESIKYPYLFIIVTVSSLFGVCEDRGWLFILCTSLSGSHKTCHQHPISDWHYFADLLCFMALSVLHFRTNTLPEPD